MEQNMLRKTQKPVVLAVCGRKNTGKTALVEGVIPLLSAAGERVAVIKHHGHELHPDLPGTDTYRFYHAGAVGTIISDDESFQLVRRVLNDLTMLIACFPDADIILIEGYKHEKIPRIETLRGGKDPESDLDLLIAVCGDRPDSFDENNKIPVLSFGDFKSASELILAYCALSRQL